MAYRAFKARREPFDGAGAALRGGRWNSPGRPVVYCAGTFAGALLEILARAELPAALDPFRAVMIEIPADIAIETVQAADMRGWDAEDRKASRAAGDAWLDRGRAAVLVVPSVVGWPFERHVIINPAHVDAARVVVGESVKVRWDARLRRR